MRIYINEIKLKMMAFIASQKNLQRDSEEVGQMLVDSDNYGFAYLLDDGQSYSYLILFRKHGRCCMRIEINESLLIIILELKHFQEELDYVLNNIEGNNNYGKEFVSAVEKTFELE